jgi:hypothetical protein
MRQKKPSDGVAETEESRTTKKQGDLTTKDLAQRSPQPKVRILITKHTKSTKEENILLSDLMSSPLSGLRVLRDLRDEKVFHRMAHS